MESIAESLSGTPNLSRMVQQDIPEAYDEMLYEFMDQSGFTTHIEPLIDEVRVDFVIQNNIMIDYFDAEVVSGNFENVDSKSDSELESMIIEHIGNYSKLSLVTTVTSDEFKDMYPNISILAEILEQYADEAELKAEVGENCYEEVIDKVIDVIDDDFPEDTNIDDIDFDYSVIPDNVNYERIADYSFDEVYDMGSASAFAKQEINPIIVSEGAYKIIVDVKTDPNDL